MKKALSIILAAVLAIALMLALASCGEVTAYQLVSDAIGKNEALDAMDASVDMKMKMATQGVTLEMPLTGSVKASGLKGENPVALVNMQMSLMGQNIATSIYTEDGDAYVTMSVMGMSINRKVKAGEVPEDYDLGIVIESVVKRLPEEMLKDAEVVKNSDGTKTVAAVLPEESFGDIYNEIIGKMMEKANLDTDVNMSLSDTHVEITVDKNGYLSAYKLLYKMNITMLTEGKEVKVDADVETVITYHNPGAAVTVTPPEGYQEFPEADADDFAA